MARKFVVVLVLASLMLCCYSASTAFAVSADGTAISMLDVCSKKAGASFTMSPILPEPVFNFSIDKPAGELAAEENLIFSSISLPAIDRPPVV